ncbi:hypothetical protein H5410_056008 [Solanum commersonii]|uniref:DUF4283 domain-containing protein n=1 Tax=Solanum commersonii TaxID=4109 RepID=A0A9J5WK11_SOLCO|nr:hypothetical protein H5410_056008 [Solanum commersonii]
MTTSSPAQPPTGADLPEIVCPASIEPKPIHLKPVAYLHGEPRVLWEKEEVENMIIKEKLEFAVIRKFSYGWPEIHELRKIIPKQCDLKGKCNIGLLSNRHVLIRASNLEDYVNLLSKPA